MTGRLVTPTLMHVDALRKFLEAVEDAGEALPFDPPSKAPLDVISRYIDNLARGFWTSEQALETESISHHYWYMLDDEILGQATLRSELRGEFGQTHGHVGYGISPLHRNRGHGTHLLGLLLEKARESGLKSVLITCAPRNLASRRVIERNSGVWKDRYAEQYERFEVDLSE